MEKILAINCGSSSLKFKLFEMPQETVVAQGLFERIGIKGSAVTIKYADKKFQQQVELKDHKEAVQLLLKLLLQFEIIHDFSEISGVGHRVVAGGEYFKKSVVIDDDVMQKIDDLKEYAPLHNPANLMGIRAFKKVLPDAISVAVFDTAFHQTMPAENFMYGIPYEWYKKYGVRRYGAHGTSHRYVAAEAAKMLGKPLEDLKLITCHLGAGASVCAVKNGKSFDTSMGFTPLTGLMMATRSGDVDVSLVAYMMRKLKMKSMPEMLYQLNHKSGMLGVSGLSSDMRDIEDAQEESHCAWLALKMFERSVVGYIGQYTAEMGGVDAIVFTAGIGENGAEPRRDILQRLTYMGLDLNEDTLMERKQNVFLTKPTSRVQALRISTNEELMIARDVVKLQQA